MNLSISIPYLIADTAAQQSWALGHEGLSPAWAFLIFVVLVAATIVAYLRCSPDVTIGKKIAMMTLRIVSSAVITTLLTKPVLRITEHKAVKQPLAVLVDTSKSMKVADRRETPIDLGRAAIASGLIEPTADPNAALPAGIADQVKNLTRQDMVDRLAANTKLGTWSKLAAQSDLFFYGFGAGAKPTGTASFEEGTKKIDVSFPKVESDEPVTAIGESLRQILQEPRSQRLGGVVLISDGGNNQGSSPLEAAQIAREQNVPLFIYAVGVTSPPDIEVKEVTTQSLAFMGERLEVKAKIASRNLEDKPATIILKADGDTVGQVEMPIGGDREQEAVFSFVPQKAGEVKIEVSVPVRPEEVGKENNLAATSVRITDKKFNVLLIEQEPRWDFRYLLDYLQRDPRLDVKCVMINGEPGLSRLPDSPFLPALPDSRDTLFASQVLILGDVNPKDLGQERMEMIAEWVEAGGGVIFLAGSNFNPSAYVGTPLEPLLPVIPDGSVRELRSKREPESFPLELTTVGRRSPYLQMDSNPEVNKQIWDAFPGVRWVAPVSRAKPGAEVLIVDPRSNSAGRYGPPPVVAMQGYGSGKCVYFGTDETYRWRSKTGEKYYSVLWGQIMQTLALQLLDSASSLTQLRTDSKQYQVGDRVVIAGNVYTENYTPVMEPSLAGVLTLQKKGAAAPETGRPVNLLGTGKNGYRGEFVVTEPGIYSFHTALDPNGVLKFEVVDNNLETTQTALDDRLLKGMATAAGGRLLREEDLVHLPEWISATSMKVATYRKVELYYSAWILTGLLGLLFAEWLLRRMTRLK